MSTNYYRIPKQKVIRDKYLNLVEQINNIDIFSPESVSCEFKTIKKGFDNWSPWDEFIDEIKIHLGQRASGWKFLWNFNDDKFYSNKEQLLTFIRSGRVVDEYGELQHTEEFIRMALEWGQPDGKVLNKDYFDEQEKLCRHKTMFSLKEYYDKEVDGLRVSKHTEFS
jgi:hypothetical protein